MGTEWQVNQILYCQAKLQHNYRQVSFYIGVKFLKNVMQIEHKIPIYNRVVPWGLGNDSLILYSV